MRYNNNTNSGYTDLIAVVERHLHNSSTMVVEVFIEHSPRSRSGSGAGILMEIYRNDVEIEREGVGSVWCSTSGRNSPSGDSSVVVVVLWQ